MGANIVTVGSGTHLYQTKESRHDVYRPYLESEASTSRYEECRHGVHLVGKGEFPKDRVGDAIDLNQGSAVSELARSEMNSIHQIGRLVCVGNV